MVCINALKTLDEAVVNLTNLNTDDRVYMVFRDSLIKRFEYSYDTFWKLLKRVLEEKYGIEYGVSPRTVFRSCFELNIVDESEFKQLLNMISARNLTSHTYDEKQAAYESVVLPTYSKLMNNIVNRLQEQHGK